MKQENEQSRNKRTKNQVKRMKRGLPVILALFMAISFGWNGAYAATEKEAPSEFTDIAGHWAEDIIKEASDMKIVGGYPDGTYRPDNLIKREEFFKLLTNILTVVPDTTGTVVKFTDVDQDEWYVPTIKIAVAAGIASGYDDGTFGIGLMISRQEAAKVAGSVITDDVSDDAAGAESAHDRAAIADWAYDYVDLMFKKGYMKGDDEGNFRPAVALTRAEAATILLNIKKQEEVIAANADVVADSKCIKQHGGMEGMFTAGKGTETEPYEISTEAQLDHMRMHMTEGAFYILKKNIAITKDYVTASPSDWKTADWSEGNFQPIGSEEVPFKGSLDGNGYTVSGLNIMGTEGRGDDQRDANYAGLFGCLAKGSVVKNLTVDASNIIGYQYTGAIAGYSDGEIENCQLGSKGIIKGYSCTGGLVGYSSQPLSKLKNKGTVTGTGSETGGIAGKIDAAGTAMVDCRNEGSVTGYEKIGGIAGAFIAAADADSIIRRCDNKGTVTSESSQAGGIAGYVESGYYGATIENCGNSGEVTGSGVNGGIAGWLYKDKSLLKNCNNTGSVGGSGAGGIAGKSEGTISFCYNSGTVIADVCGGGIVAYQLEDGVKITQCYNEGNVLSNSYAGGIAGENQARIEYSYNSGKVRGPGIGGGVAGKNTGTVRYVYGAGTVTSESNSGSLIGRNSGSLMNSFWLNTSCAQGVALEDGNSGQQSVVKVTHEELSGQKKIKTTDGYVMVIDLLNEKEDVWEYLYIITVPASDNTSVISDGGNIVSPITVPSTDSSGNTIDDEDLNSKYLYPAIIN